MACFLVNAPRRLSKKGNGSLAQKCTYPHMQTDQMPQKGKTILHEECDLQLGSPAKINLFLRIMEKRPDGFHNLASLFQSISLRDTLYFYVKKDGYDNFLEDTLECSTLGVPTDSSNLVIKALKKFREKTGSRKYFHVHLVKEIPHAAGLGGGSSNAATALWASNELNGRPCSTQDLVEFGSEFGSDISFFLSSGTAYCTGRGEILENISQLPQKRVYIVKPPEGLSTGLVFKNLDLSQCSKKDPKQLLGGMQKELNPSDFVNDLEVPSFRLLPRLGALKEKLYKAGFHIVMMSGSGTSFFCLGEPLHPKNFRNVFPEENNVKVYEATFQGRPSPEAWYFE